MVKRGNIMIFNKKNTPLYISSGVLIIVLLIWIFPEKLGLVHENISISEFRSDLKDLTSLFYIVITLWLVLVTRKMVEISINSQKALNRPEILCELFINDEKPDTTNISGIKNVEIRNTIDAKYIENQDGACVFIIIKNRYGGGKAINININAQFSAKNPENLQLERKLEIDFLAEGDAIALYIYRYEKPSTDNCHLGLVNCELSHTNPFAEASNEPLKTIKYNRTKSILAKGNHIGAITLSEGIRITE